MSTHDLEIDPQLAAFYEVTTIAELLAAQEEHILKLQDRARRNVKPWEDTFPPTLLPKYLRDSGLAPSGEKETNIGAYNERVQEGFFRTELSPLRAAQKSSESFGTVIIAIMFLTIGMFLGALIEVSL